MTKYVVEELVVVIKLAVDFSNRAKSEVITQRNENLLRGR
jgi:hypothetical protein